MSQQNGFFSFLDHITYVDDDASSYEVDIGDNGFSYLDMGSEKKARSFSVEEKLKRQTSAALDGSTQARGTLNVKKVESVDHDAMCLDTNLEQMIREFQERRQRISWFPIAAIAFGLLFLMWASLPELIEMAWLAMLLSSVLLFPGGGFLLWNVWRFDYSRKHMKMAYRFSGNAKSAFDNINQAFSNLSGTQQLLCFLERRFFEDVRYSGGASDLPVFSEVSLRQKKPPLLETEFDVWHLRAAKRDFFFMPDHLLVLDGANVGGINYAKLEITKTKESAQARGKAKQTADCNVIGSTHRFVNKDGTPDGRFNNNVVIPIIEYGVFHIKGQGLDLMLYASRQDVALAAPGCFTHMQQLGGLEQRPTAALRRKDNVQDRVSSEGPKITQTDQVRNKTANIVCPSCAAAFKNEVRLAGRVIACPRCKEKFRVPGVASA